MTTVNSNADFRVNDLSRSEHQDERDLADKSRQVINEILDSLKPVLVIASTASAQNLPVGNTY